MSLASSNIKLNRDVDQSVRRFQAAITRDLEQLYLLLGQGKGGFSNESPGSVSQDPATDGMGIEGNQGDYRFSPPVSEAELSGLIDLSPFMLRANNLSDVDSDIASNYNIDALKSGGYTLAGTYTSGSGTHVFQSSSLLFIAIIIAAGGGGAGGSVATGSGAYAGSGAASGEVLYCFGRIRSASLSYTVGAAGTGGGVGGFSGASGSNSSITHASQTLLAHGGTGAITGTPGPANVYVSNDFSNFHVIRIPGESGHYPTIQNINYDGAGHLSSYSPIGGYGGRAIAYGGGGRGGDAGNPGSDGIDGRIFIYEQ